MQSACGVAIAEFRTMFTPPRSSSIVVQSRVFPTPVSTPIDNAGDSSGQLPRRWTRLLKSFAFGPMSWIKRLASAVRSLLRVRRGGSHSATTGLTIVRARAFGRDREMQLLGRVGYHASAKSCDRGSSVLAMLTASDVHRDSLPAFLAFMQANPLGVPEIDRQFE